MITVKCQCGYEFTEPDYMYRRTSVCSQCSQAVRVTPLEEPKLVVRVPDPPDVQLRRFLLGGVTVFLTSLVIFPMFAAFCWFMIGIEHSDKSVFGFIGMFLISVVGRVVANCFGVMVDRLGERWSKRQQRRD